MLPSAAALFLTMSDDEVQEFVGRVVREMKRIRESEGMSMYRLAKLTGLHASTIGLVEKSQRSPSLFVVIKLSRALGISLGSIISDCQRAVPEEQPQPLLPEEHQTLHR